MAGTFNMFYSLKKCWSACLLAVQKRACTMWWHMIYIESMNDTFITMFVYASVSCSQVLQHCLWYKVISCYEHKYIYVYYHLTKMMWQTKIVCKQLHIYTYLQSYPWFGVVFLSTWQIQVQYSISVLVSTNNNASSLAAKCSSLACY